MAPRLEAILVETFILQLKIKQYMKKIAFSTLSYQFTLVPFGLTFLSAEMEQQLKGNLGVDAPKSALTRGKFSPGRRKSRSCMPR